MIGTKSSSKEVRHFVLSRRLANSLIMDSIKFVISLNVFAKTYEASGPWTFCSDSSFDFGVGDPYVGDVHSPRFALLIVVLWLESLYASVY